MVLVASSKYNYALKPHSLWLVSCYTVVTLSMPSIRYVTHEEQEEIGAIMLPCGRPSCTVQI